MLIFDLSGSGDIPIKYDLVAKEAARIGQETIEVWNQVFAKAKEEVAKRQL